MRRRTQEASQKHRLLCVNKIIDIASAHRPPRSQSDVDEYVGGPDGDVEATLKRVQDALAYVNHPRTMKQIVLVVD